MPKTPDYDVVVVEQSTATEFMSVCQQHIDRGYHIIASHCCVVQAEHYDYPNAYLAILAKPDVCITEQGMCRCGQTTPIQSE